MTAQYTINQAVRDRETFPTPLSRDWKGETGKNWGTNTLPDKVGGHLNPNWVEWLMGWPIGWTDLKPLGMDKFRQWLNSHGRY
jgi:DNA (cytosine-5)-methyltransferase 1